MFSVVWIMVIGRWILNRRGVSFLMNKYIGVRDSTCERSWVVGVLAWWMLGRHDARSWFLGLTISRSAAYRSIRLPAAYLVPVCISQAIKWSASSDDLRQRTAGFVSPRLCCWSVVFSYLWYFLVIEANLKLVCAISTTLWNYGYYVK